jgi:hypothetical protein
MVVEPGETVTWLPERFPGIQVYVTVPPAYKVVVSPAQILVLEAMAKIGGAGTTVTATVFVPEQPAC